MTPLPSSVGMEQDKQDWMSPLPSSVRMKQDKEDGFEDADEVGALDGVQQPSLREGRAQVCLTLQAVQHHQQRPAPPDQHSVWIDFQRNIMTFGKCILYSLHLCEEI